MNVPDWLAQRGGSLQQGLNAQTWFVTLNGHMLYRLFATTAKGQLTCTVTQANNGERLDGEKLCPTVEAALVGGLDELRDKLGW